MEELEFMKKEDYDKKASELGRQIYDDERRRRLEELKRLGKICQTCKNFTEPKYKSRTGICKNSVGGTYPVWKDATCFYWGKPIDNWGNIPEDIDSEMHIMATEAELEQFGDKITPKRLERAKNFLQYHQQRLNERRR